MKLRDSAQLVGRVQSVNNQSDLFAASLNRPVQLAGRELADVNTYFSNIYGTPSLGYGALKGYRITIDQRDRRVHFDSP